MQVNDDQVRASGRATHEQSQQVVSAVPVSVTDAPVRVQLSRKKGWRMPPNTISVARPGKFGNPFTKENAIESGYASEDTWQAFVVRCFHDWLTSKSGCDWWQGPQSDARLAVLRANLPDLRGKNLACWCRLDAPCHAEVLIELANAQGTSAGTAETGTGSGLQPAGPVGETDAPGSSSENPNGQ